MTGLLLIALGACSGSDDGTGPTDDGSTESSGHTGLTTTSSTGDTAATGGVCEPSVEVGTGSYTFEPLGETVDMIHGPQGGWHLVSSVRVCDLGNDATLQFSAVRVSDALEVGGSGLVDRVLVPDGPCCYTVVDVYTYLFVPGYPIVPDALHGQEVRLSVEVTLPGGEVWTDSAEAIAIDLEATPTE
jgi:hypothetical protein